MSVKDDLEIILITYNRKEHLKRTFEQILSEDSPIKDFQITVLDNNSTDSTEEYVKEVMQKHSNIFFRKNKYNVGIAGNIAKAIDFAEKKYFWIIADDDKYDWSGWAEVEDAIKREEELICVSTYAIKNKNNMDEIIKQFGFIPAGIYKRSSITNEVMLNVFYNIYTLFPHLPIVLSVINEEKPIYICEKPLVDNGMDVNTTDVSFTRGYINEKLYPRINNMSWTIGFLNVIEILKDKSIKARCVKYSSTTGREINRSFKPFLKSNWNYAKSVSDLFFVLSLKDKILFLLVSLKFYFIRLFFTLPYKNFRHFIKASKNA